jgi:hypothetical protein
MEIIKSHGDKFKDRKLSFELLNSKEIISSIRDFTASGFMLRKLIGRRRYRKIKGANGLDI